MLVKTQSTFEILYDIPASTKEEAEQLWLENIDKFPSYQKHLIEKIIEIKEQNNIEDFAFENNYI